MVRGHLVACRVIVVAPVVLIAHGVIPLMPVVIVAMRPTLRAHVVIVVMRIVVVMLLVVAARVVLVAGAVTRKLVDGSTAVTSRIGFTPRRYISCGRCARRTPPQGSAPRDCLPFQS